MKTHNWKSNYFSTLDTEIDKIKEEGHYRVFNNIERKAGQYPKATRHHEGNTEEIDVWCSNDYLGMSQNKHVISAMQSAAEKLGAGSGGKYLRDNKFPYSIRKRNCSSTSKRKSSCF